MNKKGVFNGSISMLIGLFIFILILTALLPYQLGNKDQDIGKSIEVLDKVQKDNLEPFKVLDNQSVIINVVNSFMGFVMYSSIEVTKAGLNYGVQNPQVVNARTLLWLVIISLLCPIVIVLFKFIIIIYLLIKEAIQTKRDKENLSKLRARR